MQKAVLTLLLGLMLLASGSANALSLNCQRTVESHDAFSTIQAFESWFPKTIRPTKADQIPTSKDTQVRFQIKGAIYDLTPSKWMLGKLPEKGGYKSVTGVRYKCNASSTQIKVAFRKNGTASNDTTQTATAAVSTRGSAARNELINRIKKMKGNLLCGVAAGYGKWSERYPLHVAEAKRRGLACGVVEDALTQVAASTLCRSATMDGKWEIRSIYQPHVAEAKRRGLTCGVRETGAIQVATPITPSVSSIELDAERQKRIEAEQELAALKAQQEKQKENIALDAQPPILTAQANVDGSMASIFGSAADNVGVAELLVDGLPVQLSSDGSFETSLYVPRNGKQVEVRVFDLKGNQTGKTLSLQRGAVQEASGPVFGSLNPSGNRVMPNNDALALIIGVADYERTPAKAAYADKDAKTFYDYAMLKLGIPASNIKELVNTDAGRIDVRLAVKDWVARSTKQNASDIYVFFAGHGLASQSGEEMYLLPYDGEPRLLEDSAIRRNRLFSDIAATNPRSVTVFLDTCYSGTTRGPEMLVASRPISIRAKESTIPEGFTVMTAAAGDQTAKPLEEAKHGMFSYFLMKGMEGDADANLDNQITAGELHAYVQKNVIQQSSGSQTPEIQGDADRVLVSFQ